MKLILENISGSFYAYVETEKHYKRVDRYRKTTRIVNPKFVLDNECNISDSLPTNSYMVFNLKDVK
jgi:hypothetical protein